MTYLKTSFQSCLSLAALLLAGCVNVVTDASTKSVNSTQTNINQVQNVNGGNAVQAAEPKFDAKAIIEEMGDSVPFECGKSPDVGVWVICKIDIPASDNVPKNELISRSAILAKRDIAEWMATETTSSTVHQSSRVEKGDAVAVEDSLKSEIKTNANVFLRGVTLYSSKTTQDGFTAYYFVTSKISDHTSELQAQLKKAPPGVVQAIGFGVVSNEMVPKARQQAVQSALQNAVEQVMGTTVIGQSQLMDNDKAKSKLISQTVGNVKQYRVVKEGRDGISYQVIVNAQVDEKSLLDNYAAMVRSMGNPGFYVKCQDPDLQAAFAGFLADLGFKVVNQEAEAAFVVNGNCKYLDTTHEYYGKGIQIDLNLQLIDKKSGQQYFNISNDPKFTTSFSGSLHQIRQSSAKKAFNKMRPELHAKLNKVVMDWVLNGRNVQVVFKNVPGTLSDDVFVKMIPHIPCATFQTKSKNGNQLILNCSYIGTSGDFEEFLISRMKKDFPKGSAVPKTTAVDLNKIEFSF